MSTTSSFPAQDEVAIPLTAQAGVPETLEYIGRDIVARIEAGDKARGRADDMYRSAGLQLIEARNRVADFSAFLRQHCKGLSRSRAYELIAIAEGKGEDVRSNNRARDHRRRNKAAGVREPRTLDVSTPSHQPPKSQAEWALREFKVAADIYFAKMDGETKRAAVAYVNGKIAGASS